MWRAPQRLHKRLLLRQKRIISTASLQNKGKASRRRWQIGSDERLSQDYHYVPTLPQQKASPGLVRANFVGNQKHYVSAAAGSGNRIHVKNGERMTKTKEIETNGRGCIKEDVWYYQQATHNKQKEQPASYSYFRQCDDLWTFGKLRRHQRYKNVCSSHIFDFLPRTAKEEERELLNAIQSPSDTFRRGIDTRTVVSRPPNGRDPKILNIMGNEGNENGGFSKGLLASHDSN